MDAFETVLTYIAFVVSGAVVALNGIAPLTKTTKDDDVRRFLLFVQSRILSVLLPMVRRKTE